jgi:hypothetical protein
MLKASLSGKYRQWDEYLPLISSSLNQIPRRTTGYSANDIVFDRRLADVTFTQSHINKSGYTENLHAATLLLDEIVHRKLESNNTRMKQRYDKNIRHTNISIGDNVLVQNSLHIRENTVKPKFIGPYVVLECRENDNFLLLNLKTNDKIFRNYNQIKKIILPSGTSQNERPNKFKDTLHKVAFNDTVNTPKVSTDIKYNRSKSVTLPTQRNATQTHHNIPKSLQGDQTRPLMHMDEKYVNEQVNTSTTNKASERYPKRTRKLPTRFQ